MTYQTRIKVSPRYIEEEFLPPPPSPSDQFIGFQIVNGKLYRTYIQGSGQSSTFQNRLVSTDYSKLTKDELRDALDSSLTDRENIVQRLFTAQAKLTESIPPLNALELNVIYKEIDSVRAEIKKLSPVIEKLSYAQVKVESPVTLALPPPEKIKLSPTAGFSFFEYDFIRNKVYGRYVAGEDDEIQEWIEVSQTLNDYPTRDLSLIFDELKACYDAYSNLRENARWALKLALAHLDVADASYWNKEIDDWTATIHQVSSWILNVNTIFVQRAAEPEVVPTGWPVGPDYLRYYPGQKSLFPEGGDAWEALNAGREIILDSKSMIVDIWDSVTKNVYDVFGNITGHRDYRLVWTTHGFEEEPH